MDSSHEDAHAAPGPRTDAERRIEEAFHRAKLGLPLTDHQLRIVQFLGHGFGCHSCPPPEAS